MKRHYLLASDFDQTLSFNDSGHVLSEMDDVMDNLQKELFRAIFAEPAPDETAVQRSVQVALVGRYYERIADHAVNTAERIDYMVRGIQEETPTVI